MSARPIRPADEQYTPIAAAYVTSPIHAQGADLPRLVELAELGPGQRLLDVGTGTGHTGLAFARAGVEVVGLDMTRAMLAQAVGQARAQGAVFDPVQSYAERMPFADGAFDGVACRYCAHHFVDVRAALGEMRRVLRPGGKLVFVDHVAPEDDEADEFVNRLDWLRDPSHRREPRLSEYRAWLAEVGLEVTHVEPFRETIVVDQWFARAQTAPDREAEARALLAHASPALREMFAIREEPVSFELQMVVVGARGAGGGEWGMGNGER